MFPAVDDLAKLRAPVAKMIVGDDVVAGEQGRDFTFVANAVQANLRALEAPADRVAGRVFNVACSA